MTLLIKRPVMAAIAALFLAPLPVFAAPQTVTETAILQAAMHASPDFQAVELNASNDKADAAQIKRLDNPTLEFNAVRTSAPSDKSNSYDFELEQPLKLSHLTGARATLANSMTERAEIRRQHGMIQAFWATKTLYAQTWHAQEQARLYADFQQQAKATAASIQRSVKAGQTPISEGSLFAGDAAKFGSDLAQIKANEAQLRLQLEKATGMDLTNKQLGKPDLYPVQNDASLLETQAQRNASLVRLLETDLRTAERQKQVATADSIGPEIAPRFIYGRAPNRNEDSIGVGVVLTIPFWDRNQAERSKADAAKIYAQRQLDTLQAVPLSARLTRILTSIKHMDQRVKMLSSDALPNYRKAFVQAQRSFSAGQVNATALWQIRERLFETEQDVLNTTIEAIESRRMLSLETGTLPNNMSMTAKTTSATSSKEAK